MTDADCIVELDKLQIGLISNLVWINDVEFATASFTQNVDDIPNGVWIYNTISNKWRLFAEYPYEFRVKEHAIYYDTATKLIWIYGDDSKLLTVNMESKEFKMIKSDGKYVGLVPKLFIINKRLHVIGGSDNKHHLIWNKESKQFDIKYTFKSWTSGMHGHEVIHVKSKNILYLFGGFDHAASYPDYYNRYIWKCTIDDDYKWSKLKADYIKNYNIYYKGFILTPDEKYIVIFHADDSWLLFDIDQEKLYSLMIPSQIELRPEPGHAILGGIENDKVLVHGFVRMLSREMDVVLPDELIGLLSSFYSKDMIYLINRYNQKHFKLSLDIVLNCERKLIL